MYFSRVLLFAVSFITAAVAQQRLQFTSFPPSSVSAGTPVNLTWTGGDGSPVTIELKQGDPGNLQTVSIITGSASGNSFVWTPPSSLPSASNYALQISQGQGTPNFTPEFALTGGSASIATVLTTIEPTTSSSVTSTATAVVVISANATTSTTFTTTLAGTGGSIGTGVSIARNTTFVSQSLTTSTTGGLLAGPSTTKPTTTGATNTAAGTAASSSSTGVAAAVGGSLGVVGAAFAGLLYLL